MRRLIWIMGAAAALPGMALAEDWQKLDSATIMTALTARTLTYDAGATQVFNKDGSTLYTTDRPSTGAWRVEADRYCSQWPPSDRWTCYDIDRSPDGLSLRFTTKSGEGTIGVYTDPE